MERQSSNGYITHEHLRLAREFEYTSRTIQHTADEERKLNEQALAEAYDRHEKIRIAAEHERQRVAEDFAQHQRNLETEELLRQQETRKEAAEKAWRLEQQKKETIAAAQAAEEAATRQRQVNEAAQRALSIPKPEPPSVIPTAAIPSHAIQLPPPTTSVQPIQPTFPAPASQITTKVPITDPTIPVKAAPNGINGINGTNGAYPTPRLQPAARVNGIGATYLGLPLPETLPNELQQQYLVYIKVLMNLKEHRRIFMDKVLPDPQYKQIKGQVGDDRRFIRKSVSQLTEDKVKNREIMQNVLSKLKAALKSPFPKVSLSRFVPGVPEGSIEVSSSYVYLVNIFTKTIFAQFLVDASSDTRKADVIGLFASQVLADLQQEWQNQLSLWPILLAKFARRCPVLFGVYGNSSTTDGKMLLGWGKEEGKFVTDQRHAERVTGLSAGWASITLRDYSKAKLENPAPSWFYWRSVALIINVPTQNVTNTHYLVLKGLIEHNEQRIMKLFGNYGRMILKQAVLAYPNNQYSGQSVAAQGLRLLKDVWEKDIHLRL